MIEVKNLSFSYDKNKPFLDNISFSLNDASIGVFLGKNGAGKTTLFKSILGLVKPNSGECLVNGVDIFKLKKADRAKKIAYVPQNIEFGSLSVFDTVLLGRIAYFNYFASNKDKEIVMNTLKEIGLENLAFKNVLELSGGEKQKVAIARALVQEPEVLVFDEPTGNLDINNEQLILKEAKKLKEKGISIILSVHDINLAISFADCFYFMKDGKILKSGNESIINEELIKDVFDANVSFINHNGKKIMIKEI